MLFLLSASAKKCGQGENLGVCFQDLLNLVANYTKKSIPIQSSFLKTVHLLLKNTLCSQIQFAGTFQDISGVHPVMLHKSIFTLPRNSCIYRSKVRGPTIPNPLIPCKILLSGIFPSFHFSQKKRLDLFQPVLTGFIINS